MSVRCGSHLCDLHLSVERGSTNIFHLMRQPLTTLDRRTYGEGEWELQKQPANQEGWCSIPCGYDINVYEGNNPLIIMHWISYHKT